MIESKFFKDNVLINESVEYPSILKNKKCTRILDYSKDYDDYKLLQKELSDNTKEYTLVEYNNMLYVVTDNFEIRLENYYEKSKDILVDICNEIIKNYPSKHFFKGDGETIGMIVFIDKYDYEEFPFISAYGIEDYCGEKFQSDDTGFITYLNDINRFTPTDIINSVINSFSVGKLINLKG